jgi:hypothetical protein
MQSELQNQKPIKKTSPVVHFAVSTRASQDLPDNSTPARCQALAINYYFSFFHKRSHLDQSQLLQAYAYV